MWEQGLPAMNGDALGDSPNCLHREQAWLPQAHQAITSNELQALGLTVPQSCPSQTARVSRLPFCWMPVALNVPLTLVVNSRSLWNVATPVPWAFGQLKRNFH